MKVQILNVGPDEQIYTAQAACVRAGGVVALRDIADEYLAEPTLQAYPSPLRWLWAGLVATWLPVSDRAVPLACAALLGPTVWFFTHSLAASPWAAASPLTLLLGQRRLQDVPVALVTLLAIGEAAQHNFFETAVAVFILLSLKESAVLSLPAVVVAWLVEGGEVLPLIAAIGIGIAAWAVVLAVTFGRNALKLLRVSANGHGTSYAKEHQQGAPHRLLVDLFLASPAAVIFAVMGASRAPEFACASAALLLAYAAAPVRNVRFVLAADILLRIVGAHAMTWPMVEVPIVLAVDALIYRRLRGTYDPVTAALTTALGMTPAPAK